LSAHTFFFYGSLMDLELLEAVIDRSASHLAFVPGWLTGYVAQTAHGYSFPTLIERKGARVDGLITQGLTDDDIARIAYFEDTEYAPTTVDVTTAEADLAAQVFMATATLRSSGEPWSFEHWRHHQKPLLVAVTRRVMREHYGITPFEEIDTHWHRIKAELEGEVQPAARRKNRR
jgi:ADP-ribose pyrophosphatase